MIKKTLIPLLVAAIAFGGAASVSAQQIVKIGTVDMKKIFESYYKTKEAEQRINEQRNAAKKELEDRVDEFKKHTEEVQKLNDEIERPELSKDAKESKRKLRDDKTNELKTMDREIREFQATREKQLQEQSVRMRAGIVDEINKVINDHVKSDQYDVVFDRSGPSLNGVPVLLYSKESFDFTNDVITTLNKNKGSDKADSVSTSSGEATPAAATPKKKKN